MGGYRVQGKTVDSYKSLLEDALTLQEAGVFSLLLEAMPPETAGAIRQHLEIPVYGIGSGDRVDGQLVIIHDILGLFEQFTPKFVKRYLEGGKLIGEAIRQYAQEVRSGAFPSPEHFYAMDPSEALGIVLSEKKESSGQPMVNRLEEKVL